jgi:hypothetical protein
MTLDDLGSLRLPGIELPGGALRQRLPAGEPPAARNGERGLATLSA